MKSMDKTDEFDFDLAQSILKSNSKKKCGKSDVDEMANTSIKLNTGHPTPNTRKRNWAQGESNS